MKPLRWWGNTKRAVKRNVDYESAAGRVIRNGLPKPGGCLLPLLGGALLITIGIAWFWM
jgi:hypothetical protein